MAHYETHYETCSVYAMCSVCSVCQYDEEELCYASFAVFVGHTKSEGQIFATCNLLGVNLTCLDLCCSQVALSGKRARTYKERTE